MTTENFDIERNLQDIAGQLFLMAKLLETQYGEGLVLSYGERDSLKCMIKEIADKVCDCIGEYDQEYRELTRDTAEPATAS